MADSNSDDKTQDVEVEETETKTTVQSSERGADDKGDGKVTTFSAEYVQGLRNENASWRTKYNEAKTALTEKEKAEMTEVERLNREAEEWKKKYEAQQAEVREAKIMAAATAADARYPAKIVRLVPDDTELDEEGLKKAMRDLKKEMPELFRNVDVDGGKKTEPSGKLSINDQIRQIAGRGLGG